ncbi:MAG: FKBP-type peptidyl-prolyl cis-trans isomerase [Clostridia bacterium]|nr:FKBP-type peptidyl-prolyl cis-trans isomerase [Clostridia bacterium]
MKKIISLIICIICVFSLVSCTDDEPQTFTYSINDLKYQYTMSEYVTLPTYKGTQLEFELDYLQQKIDNGILTNATEEYVASRGDDIYVTLEYFKVDYLDPETQTTPQQGEKITEISGSFLLEDLGAANYCSAIEARLMGLKIGSGTTARITLPADFKYEEYRGKSVYVKYSVDSKKTQLGDIIDVSYTGYYVDENGNILKDEKGADKIFDKATSDSPAKVYIGAYLFIEDFEKGLVDQKIGDELEIYVTFPSDYPSTELAGKKALFKAKIEKMYIAPTYDIQYIKEYYGSEYISINDFENKYKEQLANELMMSKILSGMTVISYPEREYNINLYEFDALAPSFEKTYEMSYEEYIKLAYNMTKDEYIKYNMKNEMIYYALAQDLKIEPSAGAIDEAKELLIKAYTDYYMAQSSLAEDAAKEKATSYVTEKLGTSGIYEQALITQIQEVLKSNYTIKEIPQTYDSITDAK